MTSSTPGVPRNPARIPAREGDFRRSAALAACADVALILVFAAIGRDAHQRAEALTGVLATAWPFLAGAAVAGWFCAPGALRLPSGRPASASGSERWPSACCCGPSPGRLWCCRS